jgi:hypothetical protein
MKKTIEDLISAAEDLIKDLERYVNDDEGGIPDWSELSAAVEKFGK